MKWKQTRSINEKTVVFFHAELSIKLFSCKKTSTKLFVSTLRFVERSARNESLYELAFKDMMTGFYNRNYLRMIMDTHNKVDNSTVIYFDIDELKTINDQYGHAIGDKVIVGFAEHIKRSTLYPCTIIRLGGDKFTSIIYDRL
ncbi:GGDEF domain-containing protein [Vibrio sp. ER1A]|uniref:GGDEF domain-containing protein n=1 Tax=Vibrio sp. ER1A TaxID=1517681 RepID=UPI0004DD221B|nr:GGDEF domain-containing protein [Vibrio sp. ER1A]KFA95868.1 hypothetical protein HW45_22930 [Vibrio sp. ER1A]